MRKVFPEGQRLVPSAATGYQVARLRWPTGDGPAVHPYHVYPSGEEGFHHLAVDVGETEVAALEAEGELFVVDAEQMQDGGVQVVHVNLVLGDVEAQFVAFA